MSITSNEGLKPLWAYSHREQNSSANFLQELPIFMQFSLKDVEFQTQTADSQYNMTVLLP